MVNPTRAHWFWGRWSAPGLTIALVTCALDQAHKWWMLRVVRIEDKGRVYVTPFLDWFYVNNTGISYGLMPGWVGPWALFTFSIVASIALYAWLVHGATNRVMALSIGLIIGGAVGNAIDRVHLGGVADYFSAHAFGYYWYVFNIADAAIVAGVIGLLYDSLWGPESK